MLINGIFEILVVGSPPVLPCSRGTICCQCVCALVTQHPTPSCRPTLILKLTLMGQCSELPRGMGQTSPIVAWKTLLKRANTIPKLTGVCLLLKSPSLATVREVMKMSRGSGDSLHGWHRHKPLHESDLH